MQPSSVDAPVDGMPVANQGQNKQQDRDQQKPGSFRRIDVVSRMLGARHICFWWVWHAPIVARRCKRVRLLVPVLHYRLTVCEKQVLAIEFGWRSS